MGVDRTERLLNLVITLLASPRPVGRDAIRSGVPGYADSASESAFERMFERDKDELRSMGIPVEAVGPEGEIEGYRIRGEAYALTLDATPSEVAVLGLAAAAWDSAIAVGSAQGAMRKVESIAGVLAGAEAALEFRGGAGAASSALAVLLPAIRDRQAVRFDYRKPGQPAEGRHVHPWSVTSWRSSWYLVGWDCDRDERRVFRLSRIDGRVLLSGPPAAFVAPEDHRGRDVVQEWASAEFSQEIVVQADSGGAAALRLRAEEVGTDLLRVACRDPREVLTQVLAGGERASIVAPPDLRSEAIERLRAVMAAHS